jgi:glycosyltransferase involved in cell wall biosynthesis
MKVVLTSWAPFIGGAEVAVERLALGLMEYGNEVSLIVGTKGEALARFEKAGIRCLHVEQRFTDKWKWLSYRASRNHLVKILAAERPDIVHSNDLPTHQMSSDAAKRLGIPRVCHHRWIFQQQAIDWLNKFSAEQHLFVSQALMEMLCSESDKLSKSKCAVVYDGLPIPELPTEKDRADAKHELKLAGDRVAVLFAGQIIERKGVADLLNAWHQLPTAIQSQANLYIVGDDLENQGQYKREMQQLANQLKLDAQFLGFQKNIPRWLTAADFVLVPSHAEPLGNATLEAMAFGRPVIGTRVGGIPEMIDENQTGLLVPAKSPLELSKAIEHLITTPVVRVRLGSQARVCCERRFSLKTHTENILNEYEQVLRRASAKH